MAKVNNSTLTPPRSWCKHLRKFGKRHAAKSERRAARRAIHGH